MGHTLAQTYVWHEGTKYFVSTINRECSSDELLGSPYAETLAWKIEKGGMVQSLAAQGSDRPDSIGMHLSIVQDLHEKGAFNED